MTGSKAPGRVIHCYQFRRKEETKLCRHPPTYPTCCTICGYGTEATVSYRIGPAAVTPTVIVRRAIARRVIVRPAVFPADIIRRAFRSGIIKRRDVHPRASVRRAISREAATIAAMRRAASATAVAAKENARFASIANAAAVVRADANVVNKCGETRKQGICRNIRPPFRISYS